MNECYSCHEETFEKYGERFFCKICVEKCLNNYYSQNNKICTSCNQMLSNELFEKGRSKCKTCYKKIRKDRYKSKYAPEKIQLNQNYDLYDAVLQCLKDVEINYKIYDNYDHIINQHIRTVYHIPSDTTIYRSRGYKDFENRVSLLHAALLRSDIEYKTPEKYENDLIEFNTNVNNNLTFRDFRDESKHYVKL